MSNQKSLKEEIKENKQKFGELSFLGKIQFIKDYYHLHIYAVIIFVLLVISIILTIRSKDFETAINMIIVNNPVVGWYDDNDPLEAFISDGFAEHIQADNIKTRVLVNDYFLVADSRDSELSAINSQTITAMFAGGEIDIFIADNKAIDYFASDIDPFFTDLSLFLDEETYELAKDHIVSYTYKDGASFPFALDITGTAYATDAKFVSDQVIIAVPDNTKRPTAALEFIRYILDYNESHSR